MKSYFVDSNGECSECVSPCKECLNETTCLNCQGAKKLFQNKCLDDCPPSYFSLSDSICRPCYPSCLTCTSIKLNQVF